MGAVAFLIVLASQGADEARALFDRGAALTAEHKYQEAAQAFKASFEKDPRKEALFAWAQVERLGGNCAAAIGVYRRFLEQTDLAPAQREAAELNIRRCEAIQEAPELPALPPRPQASTVVAPVPPEMVMTTPARSQRAVIAGMALMGGAVGALGGSVTFFLLARNDERKAASGPTWGDYSKALRRGNDRERLAAGLAGASVALGAGALIEWLLTTPKPRLSAWVGPEAAGLGGRF